MVTGQPKSSTLDTDTLRDFLDSVPEDPTLQIENGSKSPRFCRDVCHVGRLADGKPLRLSFDPVDDWWTRFGLFPIARLTAPLSHVIKFAEEAICCRRRSLLPTPRKRSPRFAPIPSSPGCHGERKDPRIRYQGLP